MAFKKISNKEYEITLDGRTKTILIPFGKTELIFKEFINSGGVIDPDTGEVQTDIITLISSFKQVGNILLTEYDETGKVTVEGNCTKYDYSEVIELFQLATEVVANFMQGLMAAQKKPETQTQGEKSPEETTKD